MSPSAVEKSGEFSRSASVMPISTYGLSVKRCAAGRSTPTAASTLPGKLSRAVHPHGGVGELHHRRLEVGGVVVGAGLVGGLGRSRRSSRWWRRAVRSPRRPCAGCPPRPRRLRPVNTVGAIADSCRIGVGRQRLASPGSDRALAARIASRSGSLRVPTRGQRRARPCRDTTAGSSSRRAARRRRCATAGPARTARRAGHRRAPRCAAAPRAPRCSPAAWRTVHDRGGAGSSAARIGCAGFVGPALIAQHAGAGDLGGAGDHRSADRPATAGLRPS